MLSLSKYKIQTSSQSSGSSQGKKPTLTVGNGTASNGLPYSGFSNMSSGGGRSDGNARGSSQRGSSGPDRPSTVPNNGSSQRQETLSLVEQRLRIVKRNRGTKPNEQAENRAAQHLKGVTPPVKAYPVFDTDTSAVDKAGLDELKNLVKEVVDQATFSDVFN